MLKRYGTILVVLAMLLSTLSVFAQFRANKIGGGAAIGGTLANTGTDEFEWDSDGGVNFRVFLRHSVSNALEIEIGANLAQLRADEYRSSLNPVDARLLLRLFESNSFSPYVYGGIGALFFHVEDAPANANVALADQDGWGLVVPVGLGMQFRVDDYTSFEVQAGYNLALADEFNGLTDGSDDPYVHATAGFTMSGYNWNGDPDGDGLTNRQEKDLGTDPNIADSDGDGLSDGAEHGTYNTDPLKADTDGDGLSDGDEINKHKSSPTKSDSDGDGLDDKAEVETHGTNPMKADSDGDGLNDNDELMTHKTDPNKADSDSDGLNDGEEINTTKTDPMKADTDGDTLRDGAEVNKHKTNPLKTDTDDGTVNDGREVARGTNPLNAADDVIIEINIDQPDAAIVLGGVTFATGSATLTEESKGILDKAYNTMLAYPAMVVEIHGYTDNTGSRRGNLRLSQRRADSVMAYLVGKGIDGTRISAKGFGPENPVADNSTKEGRAQNRRIEFVPIKIK